MADEYVQFAEEKPKGQEHVSLVSLRSVLTPPLLRKMSPESITSGRSTSNRNRDLLGELSIEEKIVLLSGCSLTTTTGVPRLGIPALKVSDSINGVRGSKSHLEDSGTACFPSTTCLASTWNQDLMQRFGHEVGLQAKLKSVQVVIGPNVNIHRDPRGGRNFETFSEDPLLTGLLAASIVNGIQSTGVGACVKHFVGNESETLRRKYNVRTPGDRRALREIYMKAFEYLLRSSNPVSIMMAYNKVDGYHCSQTPLIREVLRNRWDFEGCIMSDWYGTRAGAESLRAGLDLEMPGPSIFRGQRMLEELDRGEITIEEINEATRHVLTMIDMTEGSHSEAAESTIICPRTSSMAYQVAIEGIVMLKNDQSLLPIDVRKAPKVHVIGAGAIKPIISGGGSACAQPQYIKSFLDCLRAKYQLPDQVQYSSGVSPNYATPSIPTTLIKTPNGENGIYIEYYNRDSIAPVYTEILQAPQVVQLGRLKPGLDNEDFYYRILTTFTAPSDGLHTLGTQATGDFELKLDGRTILQDSAPDISIEDFLFVPKKLERTTKVEMIGGVSYSLCLQVQARKSAHNGEPDPHAAKLVFQEAFDDERAISQAVQMTASTDIAIIFAGRTHEHESEGFDLQNLDLELAQIRLIESVAAVSKKVVLILHHGNPIDLTPVIDKVNTIFAAHFPGQEGASALADLIIGQANPSGRLATTWPRRLDAEHVPTFNDFPCSITDLEPEIRYEEGLQLGYRNPSHTNTERFPFGHGLSYSSFQVSDLDVEITLDTSCFTQELSVTANVRNVGHFPGHHTVQLYVEAPQRKNHDVDNIIADFEVVPWRPHRTLIAFTKIYLIPDEMQSIEMRILQSDVTDTWDETIKKWRSWAGSYDFVIADNATGEALCHKELHIVS